MTSSGAPISPFEPGVDDPDAIYADPYATPSREHWIGLIVLLIMTAAALWPALAAEFLWRDASVVTANDAIRSFRTLIYAWVHPRSQLVYRPIADAILCPQYALWKNWNPTGYKIVSVAIHLLNTTLVWQVLRRLGIGAALAGAGLFALHPIGVQPVLWAAQQPVLAATTWALLALLVFLRLTNIDPPLPWDEGGWNLSHRKWLLYFITIVLLLAALLSDAPTACAAPVAMALLLWWKRGRMGRDEWRIILPMLALAAIVAAFAAWVQRSQLRDVASPSIVQWIGIAAYAVWFHLAKLAFPWPLALTYAEPGQTARLASLVALIAAAIVLWRFRDRIGRGSVAAAGIFIVMIVAPVLLQDVSIPGGFVADHQQYLARVALLGLIAAGAARLIPEAYHELEDDTVQHRFTRPVVFVLIMTPLGALAWQQATRYENNVVAWNNVLLHDPQSRIARAELGQEYFSHGEFTRAAGEFEKLVAVEGNDATSRMRLGESYLRSGRVQEGATQFEQATRLRPTDSGSWRALASAAAQKGDLELAEAHYRKALSLDEHDDMARNNLATLLARQGQSQRAIEEYERAIELNPNSTTAMLNLANLYFTMGKLDDAANYLQRAVKVDPNNFDAYMTSGGILMNLKEFSKAAAMFRQAIRIRRDGTDAARAFNALGVCLAAEGQDAEAIYSFRRAADLDKSFEMARQNLAMAQAQHAGKRAAATSATAPAVEQK